MLHQVFSSDFVLPLYIVYFDNVTKDERRDFVSYLDAHKERSVFCQTESNMLNQSSTQRISSDGT